MIDFGKVFLLICLVGCMGYIYWLHKQQSENIRVNEPKISDKKSSMKKCDEDVCPIEEDNLSFLGSNYGLDLTKGDDSLLDEVDEK